MTLMNLKFVQRLPDNVTNFRFGSLGWSRGVDDGPGGHVAAQARASVASPHLGAVEKAEMAGF
ncbi:hypothetical protein YP76_11610 [Sphingobium chungbukense]|uniref:Uncharacterized protein n=2 Tax=Sphingobium chungbukense TaxID=56193 RepID=A0A0M3APL1_9SPHN|nr:hypothetical protein YP76_11610 [Sphingobium chungbukense]